MQFQIVKWEKITPITPEEAEARLHREGYDCFYWHDVTEASYPSHRHEYDECLWILKGQMQFTIGTENFTLSSGDRLYLKAKVTHSSYVPDRQGVHYLVGKKTQATSSGA